MPPTDSTKLLESLSVREAAASDVEAVFGLRLAAAQELTRKHGKGHWSTSGTANTAAREIRTCMVLIASVGADAVATLKLATTKPWAIDQSYFEPVTKALYLQSMAVHPNSQGLGIGRRLVEGAIAMARDWPSEAIRLDVYDSPAGAGGFYGKCGFREKGKATYRNVPLAYYELLLCLSK